MSRKERLSEFNRRNILNTAKELFLEKGVIQTTMDDIAANAECSKSTIYVYFKSKEEIFDCIVLDYCVMLKGEIVEAINTAKEFPDGYFAICNTMVKYYNAHPLYFESVLGELNYSVDESDTVRFQIYSVGEQIVGIIGNYVKTCIINGYVRADLEPLPQTILYLWAGICGVISLAHKKEKYITQEMNIALDEFMHDGFNFLLRSALPER